MVISRVFAMIYGRYSRDYGYSAVGSGVIWSDMATNTEHVRLGEPVGASAVYQRRLSDSAMPQGRIQDRLNATPPEAHMVSSQTQHHVNLHFNCGDVECRKEG